VTTGSTMLKRALRQGGVSTGLIKGEASSEPLPGYVPGYSASGQDIWLPMATHFGPGLVLSAVGARCGKVFLADGEWSVVANTVVLTPQQGHDPKFLWYLVNYEGFWEKGGTAQPYVRVPETLARHVWLPSLAEQRAIADFLDAETARIDALIAKKQQLIRVLAERLSTVVERELAGGSWPRLRLKHVCGGITVGVVVNPSSYFVDDGVPFIHGTDLRRGWIGTSRLKFLSAESNALLRKSQVRTGDVLAMRVGEPGRAAVVPPELDGSNCASVLILRQGRSLNPKLLAYFLNSTSGRTQIEAVQYGAAQGVMNVGDAVDLLVPVPPPSAQEHLLSRLERAERTFVKAAGLLNRQLALCAEHRQALITAAVTGAFDVR
jgi:type I restriction enzyme, S subunit